MSIYTENPVIKKGIRFYKEILMKQVNKSSMRNSQSYIDNSIKMDDSFGHVRTTRHEESKLEPNRHIETKTDFNRFEDLRLETGPRLFNREFDPDDSLKDLSASRIMPEPERPSDIGTRSMDQSLPLPGQPPSKEKKKKPKKPKDKSSEKKPKKEKSSGRKPKIQTMEINKTS